MWGNDFMDNVRILCDSTLVDCAVVICPCRALRAPATFAAVKQSTIPVVGDAAAYSDVVSPIPLAS